MDYDNDAGDYISVTGDGSVFTGLGPYTLDYPGSDYADVITPTATAENAFIGDNANVGAIDKFGATYFTNFAAFGYDAIVDVADRADVLSAFLSQCGGGLPPTEPEIEVTPTALVSTQMPDTITTQQLEICNVGTADLDWSITEVPGMKVTGARTETVEPAKPTHQVELSLEANGTSLPSAPAPAVPEDAVALVLDDGTRDNDIGIGGTWEMLWVNRFTPDPSEFPFNLNEVWIYFSSVGMVNVGDEIEIVIFENTTGGVDPAPGSNLLGTYFATVQALDTWNVYTLPAPVTFNGPGDAVIGAIGLEVPGTSYWPASIDQTTTQQRSWAGWYLTSPPPDPPFLPPDDTWLLIDSAGFAGNWMVRGYGETIGSDIPWLSEVPTMGTVVPGACTIVDVTFDSTGLAPDTYLGTLNVDSNDADEPTVPVGVTLNVVNPPDIVVDPTELSSTLFPDQTETQDLDVCNLGGETLTWELVETEYPNGTMEVLYDNGPQVTHPGGGFGGADASALQTALGLNTYGFGNQFLNGYRMADDFEITDPAGWNVQQITFFAYQTGSPTNPSTITGIYFQIWDGPPDDPTSTVVFGDLVTNRLANTTWSDIYRVLDTNLLNTDRPSMANTANAGVILPPGTYWLDWLTDGSLASGPWAPPISILGQTTTGNAMQYTTAWAPALDTGLLTQQGLPFVIEGQVVPSFDLEWLSEVPTSGDVLPGECETIAVTFDSTGLAVGTYTGALEFSSNDPDGAVVVPVTLEVLPFNPDVVVDPTSLALTLYPNETGLLNFTIGNVGDADLTWSLVDTGDWLTLDPIAGTVVPAGETMVDVMFDSTGLAAGTYNATVTITTNDPDEPTVTVNVTLTVVYRTFFLPVIYKTP